MILYVRQGCPFCAKVLSTAGELGVSLELRDITNEAAAAELVELGGKRQVPYLVDEEAGEEMYGSDKISAYLQRKYRK